MGFKLKNLNPILFIEKTISNTNSAYLDRFLYVYPKTGERRL
jgi:hypothetical protein